ncbi:transporter particle component [Colletotrichum lupini]|uniref:Transporter particle component n=1 Tax=Colletotrichum lupini TaxID=145971 RepID=A0A9Q8ST82_9PEZI|nr:transporter particle component [Colletotrichum lupini]UQC82157.1 transporter particle component [Colletotrichum lupini]
MANLPTTKSIPGKETPGLRYPSNGKTIYHRPLNRTKTAELSQSSFAYLFSEMVSYAQRNVKDISELEQRLNVQGHSIGLKLLDLLLFREPPRTQTRPLTIITLLHFIKQSCWQHLFGRQADRLEKSADPAKPDEYMIIDNEPLVNAYISVPREMSQLNCAAYVAGIVEGICDGAGFPARVSAHNIAAKDEHEMWPGKTVFLVKFRPESSRRRWSILIHGVYRKSMGGVWAMELLFWCLVNTCSWALEIRGGIVGRLNDKTVMKPKKTLIVEAAWHPKKNPRFTMLS